MEKLLIIYTDENVVTVSAYTEGTMVVTPYKYLVDTKANGLVMLVALGIDVGVLEDFDFEPEIIEE